MRECRKIWWRHKGHTCRRNMARKSRMLERQGYTHARTRPRFRAPARTHEYAHTEKCVIFIAFLRQQRFRERASSYVPRTLPVLFYLPSHQ
jgi:hypothetical protein